MDPKSFSDSAWGKVVRTTTGYWAFLPEPLPPRIDLSWSTIKRLSEADRALGELAGLARNLPNPHLLIRPFVGREAVLSSRIEGTQASLSDLFFFEAASQQPGNGTGAPVTDVREVANYVQAMDEGLSRLREFPVSLRFIRDLHRTLLGGVRGDRLTPGEFRRSQNWIGPPGCTLTDAVYVPPPVPEMTEALHAFERYVHADSDLPALIRMALIHYQFEAIHPFLDGNGRIGRLLITLLLCRDGLLPQPLLYLSAFFERHRDDYYRLLLGVSRNGHWQEWIEFFLAGVAQQSRDALGRAARLLDLWQDYRGRLASARSSALPLKLLDHLFERPVISGPAAAKHLGVTARTANLTIAKLLRAGLIREATGRKRGRLYLAAGIIDAIEAPLGVEDAAVVR